MYRDANAERRARAAMRHREASERARRALAMPYGSSAGLAMRQGLASVASADLSSTSHEELDAIEHALDQIDEVIDRYVADATRISERAGLFAHLGAPTSSAELCPSVVHASDPAIWTLGAVAKLREAMNVWAPQIRGEAILDAHAEGLAIFFESDSAPFRLEIEAKPLREKPETFFTETSLVGGSRSARAPIAVRPQTFGDDLLATLRIRRDITFEDDAFDPRYFVSGDEAVLSEILSREVRAAFVAIAEEEPAHVTICDRIATMKLTSHRLSSACALLRALLSSPGQA